MCAVEVLSPIVHEPPPLEQVRPGVGRFDLVADDVGQRRLDDLARVVRLLGPSGQTISISCFALVPFSGACYYYPSTGFTRAGSVLYDPPVSAIQ